MRRKVKHPVRRCLVLPLPGLQQVAHDRDCPSPAHAVGRRQRSGQAEHLVSPGNEDFHQPRAKKAAGPGDKCCRGSRGYHDRSLTGADRNQHRHHPHKGRTLLGTRAGGKGAPGPGIRDAGMRGIREERHGTGTQC